MSHRIIMILLIFLSAVSLIYAGTTGKIAGKVLDKETGDPLPGVNVIVDGLFLGASTDLDGFYYIINVPVGKHNISAQFVGYSELRYESVTVNPDHTTPLNFDMERTILDIGEVIVVEAQRERVQRDLTMSRQFVDKDEISAMPIESFENAAQLQAGAVGSNFRGGRASEAVPYVDGISIKDPTAGYDAIAMNDQMQTSIVLPEVAIEQIEVITGGFNAEYGNAQSAIINVITKEGGSEHTGRIAVKTSLFNHVEDRYMFQRPDGSFVFERDAHLQEFFDDAQPTDEQLAQGIRPPSMNEFRNLTLDDYDRQEYEFNLSGPVPFTSEKLRYSISAEMVDLIRDQVSYWGDNLTGAGQAKFTYRISPQYKLQFIGMGSMIDTRAIGYADSKYPGGYIPGYGYIAPKRNTEEFDFLRNYMGTVKWTHTISANTFYEIQAGYTYNTFERKSKDWNDRDGDGDFDEYLTWKNIRIPVDPSDPNTEWIEDLRYASDDMQYLWVDAHPESGWEGGYKWGAPGNSQYSQVWVLDKTNYTYRREWRFLTGTLNEKELTTYPIAEETEGNLYPTVPNAFFDYYGDGGNYYDTKTDVLNFKIDFTSQINHQHLVKAGAAFSRTNLDMQNVGFFSVSNLYIDDFEVTPMDFSAYIQDKMEFEGMIVNAGVRFDYFDPGDVIYPASFSDPIDQNFDRGDDGYIRDAKSADAFWSVSPRLGISHPITENTVMHFSYGHFYQRPDYRYWYENSGFDFRGQYAEMGNPSLEPEKTVAYEAGVQHNFNDYVLGVNAFYKDISNLIDQVQAGEAPFTDFWLYDNRDWADVRGFEISLRKFFSNYIAGNVNYTYMIAKGKASSTQSGGSELWRKMTGVQEAYYLDWDQRHTLNANVTLSLPQDFGPAFGNFHILGDWTLNVLYTYGSPKPYTPVTRDPQPEYNTERLLSVMQTDIKLEKRIGISNGMNAIIFLEGYNIFNRKNLSNFAGQFALSADRDRVQWLEETGSYEGRNFEPFVWGPRRHFRLGFGFQF